MPKDPAFLFYHHDFLVGTTFMTLEERGAYITLLCFLADKGKLSESDVIKVIPRSIWSSIQTKFIVDQGVVSHKRLTEEVEKRKKYAESRRNNQNGSNQYTKKRSHDQTYDHTQSGHMVNVNVNENVNKKVNNNIIKASHFEQAWNLYPCKVGKKNAERHFFASVQSIEVFNKLLTAIDNYKQSARVRKGYVANGSTFFNNWQDWLVLPENEKFCERCKNTGRYISSTGYDSICSCPAGKRLK